MQTSGRLALVYARGTSKPEVTRKTQMRQTNQLSLNRTPELAALLHTYSHVRLEVEEKSLNQGSVACNGMFYAKVHSVPLHTLQRAIPLNMCL